MTAFQPDVIIALGGGSAMDAGKIMWVMYEHPEVDFQGMAMRFIDIRKRVYTFPKMGEKAYFVAIPTSSGPGSEVEYSLTLHAKPTGNDLLIEFLRIYVAVFRVIPGNPSPVKCFTTVDSAVFDIHVIPLLVGVPLYNPPPCWQSICTIPDRGVSCSIRPCAPPVSGNSPA